MGSFPENTSIPRTTERFDVPGTAAPVDIRRFYLTVAQGGRLGERRWASEGAHCSIGSHPLNDVVIDDETVSRFHCEIRMGPDGAKIRDLGSLNGMVVDGVRAVEAFLRNGSNLRLGRAVLTFDCGNERNGLVLSPRTSFGSLVGTSVAMRACFAQLERAARSDATVLLEGETGTGKSRAAEGIHDLGGRKDGPFVVVDCASVPATLLESELFGHERGAFTGATQRRLGAFEEAHGGTIFLDEIGELSAELQPKLLRVLEARRVRRLGMNQETPVDVRIIAATHRDLRADVNTGRFRADLFYRLAVLRVQLPGLRQCPEDVPAIAENLLASLGLEGKKIHELMGSELGTALRRSAWPGNVRELRNFLERYLVFEELPEGEELPLSPGAPFELNLDLPYADVRRRAVEDFERRYVQALLQRHGGKVGAAARAAKIDRAYLYRLARRCGGVWSSKP